MDNNFYVLSLDGGGSKGVYTLGVLKELEKMLGGKLHQHFNLIYGTSTGSIIASMLALGESVADIEKKYFELIPKIMCSTSRREKSENLEREANAFFGETKFDAFKTFIGIVSMNYDKQQPLIFKKDVNQAHGMKPTFEPGFGCTISVAVQASCSAYPLFNLKEVHTQNQGKINAIDGGFIANNPSLFALIDAHKAVGMNEDRIKLLSIGVGKFVETPLNFKFRLLRKLKTVRIMERVLAASSTTNERLVNLIYPNISRVRINESYPEPEHGTNMIETDKNKLEKLVQLGRDSYGRFEGDIFKLFGKEK